MSEQAIQHRIIDPNECPRCGGCRTESLGRDGTLTETYICRDCQAANPQAEETHYYDIFYDEAVQSVNWYKADGDVHEVYDSAYLASGELALDALRLLREAKNRMMSLIGRDCECDESHVAKGTACWLCECRRILGKVTGVQGAMNAQIDREDLPL